MSDERAAAEREQRRREREARRTETPKPTKPPKAKKERSPGSSGRRLGIAVGVAAIVLGVAAIAAFAYRHFNREAPPPVVIRTITVTVPEGYTRAQTAELAKSEGLRGSYEKASVRSPYLNPARYGGKDAENLEGFLFPDTFELERHAAAATWFSCSSKTSSGGSRAST